MKLFTKIHIIFAVFFIIALVSRLGLMMLVLHLAESPDPEHSAFDLWQPRISVIFVCIQYAATIPWLLFAIYHLIVMLFQRKTEH